MLTIGEANTIQMGGGSHIADVLCCCDESETLVGYGFRREYICGGGAFSLDKEEEFISPNFRFFVFRILNDFYARSIITHKPLIQIPGMGVEKVEVGWDRFWLASEKELAILYWECVEGVVSQRLIVWAFTAGESIGTLYSLTSTMLDMLCDESDLYDHIRLWYMVSCYKNTWRWAFPRFKKNLAGKFEPLFGDATGLPGWTLPTVSFIRPRFLNQFPKFSWSFQGIFTPKAGPLLSTVSEPLTTGGWVTDVQAWNGVEGWDVDYGNIWGHALGQRLYGGNRRPANFEEVTQVHTWIIDIPVAEENRRNCAIPLPLPEDIAPDDWMLTRRIPWYLQPPDDFPRPPFEWLDFCGGEQGPFEPASPGDVNGCNAKFLPPPGVPCGEGIVIIGGPTQNDICQSVVYYECMYEELAGDWRWVRSTEFEWECNPSLEDTLENGWELIGGNEARFVSRRSLSNCESRCEKRTESLNVPLPVPFPCVGYYCRVEIEYECSTQYSLTMGAAANCSASGSGNAASVALPAGTYRVTYASGAWSPWNSNSFNNGLSWRTDRFNSNVSLPQGSGDYATSTEAEAAAVGLTTTLEWGGGDVNAWINDDPCHDNRGSITWTFDLIESLALWVGYFAALEETDCEAEYESQAPTEANPCECSLTWDEVNRTITKVADQEDDSGWHCGEA